MNFMQFICNLLVNLIAGALIFFFGLYYPNIIKLVKKRELLKFWGKSVLDEKFIICYSALIDSRLLNKNSSDWKSKSNTGDNYDYLPYPTSSIETTGATGECANIWTSETNSNKGLTGSPQNLSLRYVKVYHDGRKVNINGPWGEVVGSGEIRATSYILNVISPFRKSAIKIEPDSNVIKDLKRTIISMGGPTANEITDLILREDNNTFFRFEQDGNEPYILDCINNKKYFGFKEPIKKDYGIIIKIRNLRFPECNLFVCAGLGESGTSGASWYLSEYWKELLKSKNEEFGILLEVEINTDNSAKPTKI